MNTAPFLDQNTNPNPKINLKTNPVTLQTRLTLTRKKREKINDKMASRQSKQVFPMGKA